MPEPFRVGDVFTITEQFAERMNCSYQSVVVGQVYRVDQFRDDGMPRFFDERGKRRTIHPDGMRHYPAPPPPAIDVGYEIELRPERRQDRVRFVGGGVWGLRRPGGRVIDMDSGGVVIDGGVGYGTYVIPTEDLRHYQRVEPPEPEPDSAARWLRTTRHGDGGWPRGQVLPIIGWEYDGMPVILCAPHYEHARLALAPGTWQRWNHDFGGTYLVEITCSDVHAWLEGRTPPTPIGQRFDAALRAAVATQPTTFAP